MDGGWQDLKKPLTGEGGEERIIPATQTAVTKKRLNIKN